MKKFAANVLLIDDEQQFLKVLEERLETRGLKVNTATSGEDALTLVDDRNFDAIVLDLAMPGIDGIETLRLLKEKNPDLEIIMLTGHATVQKGIEAMKLGAEDFLEKPVDLSVLLERISEAKNKRILILEEKSQEAIKKIIKSKAW
ncbi:MAG: response regulator [Desulfobacterales bacterium]|jgi:DNA-binding NtrC family response regulator|nr:response regulator [Desulfobacterales bacterium]